MLSLVTVNAPRGSYFPPYLETFEGWATFQKKKCRHQGKKFVGKRHEGRAALLSNSFESLIHSVELTVDVGATERLFYV